MSRKFSFLLLLTLIFSGCEDVVDVEINTAAPRLVVDASINWLDGTEGNNQIVRLTTTTGYYDDEIPVVEGANVYITDSVNTYLFSDNGAGYYVCDVFEPQTGEAYTLFIEYNGQTYTATEILMPTPDLLYANESNEGLSQDAEVIRAYFNDSIEENYYMSDFFKYGSGHDSAVFDDRFVNGNLTYTLRFFDDLQQGDTFGISLYGVSKRYYDYMSKLYAISEAAATNPFRTPPMTVRGNIVNLSDPDNFAFGYFRLGEESIIEYTAQ